jgi:hypothetical protein
MQVHFVSETLWWREHVVVVGVEGYNADTYLRIMCEFNLIESEQGKSTEIREHWDVLTVTLIFRVSFRAEWLFVCSGASYLIVSRIIRRVVLKCATRMMILAFMYGTEIINETKIRLFFFSELSESSFGSFPITRAFKIYCLIFPLLNELFEGKQSNDFTLSLKANVHRCIG